MSRRKRRAGNRPRAIELPKESSAADAATICWLLAAITAIVCEFGLLAARLYFAANPDAHNVAQLGGLLIFASVVVGTIALLLTPVVYRVRQIAPPRPVTIVVVIIGAVPWVVLIAQALR